jgi:hypothetical protein
MSKTNASRGLRSPGSLEGEKQFAIHSHEAANTDHVSDL